MNKKNKTIAVSLVTIIGLSAVAAIGIKNHPPILFPKNLEEEFKDISGDEYTDEEINALTEEDLKELKEKVERFDIPQNILTENIQKKIQYPGQEASDLKRSLLQYASAGKYQEAIDQILKINETYKFTAPNNICITNMFEDFNKLQAIKDANLSTVDPNIMKSFRDAELCALASLYFSPELIISGVKDTQSYIPIITTQVNFISSEIIDLSNPDDITKKIITKEGIRSVIRVNLEIETIPVVAYTIIQAENSNVYVYGYYPGDTKNMDKFPYKTVEYWNEIQKSFGVKLY